MTIHRRRPNSRRGTCDGNRPYTKYSVSGTLSLFGPAAVIEETCYSGDGDLLRKCHTLAPMNKTIQPGFGIDPFDIIDILVVG